MKLDELTIGEARELVRLFGGGGGGTSHSLKVGEKYLVQTVTLYFTGRLTAVTDSDLVLEEAAWIADTGRFSTALKTGALNEIEPCPAPVIIPRGSVVAYHVWLHPLPTAVKP
jgi:hypothetical protein